MYIYFQWCNVTELIISKIKNLEYGE